MNEAAADGGWVEALTALVYELLDAHLDTADLAEDLLDDRWRAHLDYLGALQRKGRELVSAASASRTRRSTGSSR
jgi:hypothetical protein